MGAVTAVDRKAWVAEFSRQWAAVDEAMLVRLSNAANNSPRTSTQESGGHGARAR